MGDELTIGPVQLRVAKVGETTTAAPTRSTSSPGDTAVSKAIVPADGPDDFVIDFDEPTATPEAVTVPTPARAPAAKPAPKKGKPPAQDEDAIADFLMDIPIDEDEAPAPPTQEAPAPAPVAQVETVKTPAKPKPAEESTKGKEPEKAKEKEVSDDAIADFLLDIKLDDDE